MPLFQLISIIALFSMPLTAVGAPAVVVTIKPLHSLVAGVMAGVGEPYLLLKGGQSAHHLTLKPSQAKKLHNAELLVWIGPVFERFLERTVHDNDMPALTLLDIEGLALLPLRGVTHVTNIEEIDGHIWLAPMNAVKIVNAVVARLVAIDAENSDLYQTNGNRLVKRLVSLDTKLMQQLKSVQEIPYLTYHDALRYFERRYSLNGYSITPHSDLQLSVKRVFKIKRLIAGNNINCLFHEPDFKPKLMAVLLEGTKVKDQVVDPVGVRVDLGPDAYFQIMERIALSFKQCLLRRK